MMLTRSSALVLFLSLAGACRPHAEERAVDASVPSSPAPSAQAAAAVSGVSISPVAPVVPPVTKARDGILRAPSAGDSSSPAYAQTMCFTGDGRLAAAIWDGVVSSTAPRERRAVEIWDIEKRAKIRDLPYDDVHKMACRGDRLAIARGSKYEVIVLSTTDFAPQTSFSCDASVLALAPTNDRLVAQCHKQPVGLYGIGSDQPLLRAPSINEKTWSVDYSHDGRWLAVGTYGSIRANAYIWDLATNQVTATLGPHDARFGVPDRSTLPGDLADRPRAVTAIAFSPDDSHVATGSFDGIIRLWERSGGGPKELAKHGRVIGDVAFSSDGRYLASSDNEDVQIWSLAKGEAIAKIPAPRATNAIGSNPPSLAWSNDGRVLAMGYSNGSIALRRMP